MEIKVDKETMIKEIEKEIVEYKTDFNKAKVLYKAKVKEFLTYVEKIVKDSSDDRIKPPPSPPTYRLKEFEQSIDLLNAHVDVTLKMDNDEYTQMKEGFEQIKMSNTASINTLSSLSY